MKHTLIPALFGLAIAAAPGGIAAQQSQEPSTHRTEVPRAVRVALAKAIAAEQQENDLPKAERLYRAAMDDESLGAQVREHAAAGLASVLDRLGRGEEAKAIRQQHKGDVVSLDDVTAGRVQGGAERLKALRAEARALLTKTMTGGVVSTSSKLVGFDDETASKLFWIGAVAVPEIVAAIEQQADRPYGAGDPRVMGLFGLLWRVRGAEADAFLREAAGDERLAGVAAQTAHMLKDVDVDDPVLRAFLDHENEAVVMAMLFDGPFGNSSGANLVRRLLPAQLLTVAQRSGPRVRARALDTLSRALLDDHELKVAQQLAREARSSADAELGRAGEEFLLSPTSQQSVDGIRIVLEMLPEVHERGGRVHSFAKRRSGAIVRGPHQNLLSRTSTAPEECFTEKEAAALVPAIDRAVELLGDAEVSSATTWLRDLMRVVIRDGDVDAQLRGLQWWDAGYDVSEAYWQRVSEPLAVPLLQRYDAVPEEQRQRFLGNFGADALTPAALPVLRGIQQRQGLTTDHVMDFLIAATGAPDAASWILERWRGGLVTSNVTFLLLTLAKKSDAEPVREAMRSVVRGFGGDKPNDQDRSRLLLVLLGWTDHRGLEIAAAMPSLVQVEHPLAPNGGPVWSPLTYLCHPDAVPKHGFSPAQVAAMIRDFAKTVFGGGLLSPSPEFVRVLSDEVLCAFAVRDHTSYTRANQTTTWGAQAVRRYERRLQEGGDVAVLDRWYRGALAADQYPWDWISSSGSTVVDRHRDDLLEHIDGDNSAWAKLAAALLHRRAPDTLDVTGLLTSRHADVRNWAIETIKREAIDVEPAKLLPLLSDARADTRAETAAHLGATVCVEAVPGLIALLRDPNENVRTAAADSLTRIRFYHEQRAHWDRVQRGLDVTAESAAEKLLLQAKPGADKQQRLLAIRSLGVLGKPEALPFLIEWSQEDDAEIAKAAGEAITKIHLEPRK